MATQVLSMAGQLVMPDLKQCKKAEGAEYLKWVTMFVSEYRHKSLKLNNPRGAILKIAGLEDIITEDIDQEVDGWGKFYLPDIVNMQVIGTVEGPPCPNGQLVLMTCEDKKLYAYDGEELHVVAPSLDNLSDKNIVYPSSKSYYNGEAFKNMTEEDWAEVRKGPVGKKLDEEHQQLVQSCKAPFLENLKQK